MARKILLRWTYYWKICMMIRRKMFHTLYWHVHKFGIFARRWNCFRLCSKGLGQIVKGSDGTKDHIERNKLLSFHEICNLTQKVFIHFEDVKSPEELRLMAKIPEFWLMCGWIVSKHECRKMPLVLWPHVFSPNSGSVLPHYLTTVPQLQNFSHPL